MDLGMADIVASHRDLAAAVASLGHGGSAFLSDRSGIWAGPGGILSNPCPGMASQASDPGENSTETVPHLVGET